MSKKKQVSKNARKSKRGNTTKKPAIPFMSVPQKKVVPLGTVLKRIYEKEDLSTVCLRQCTCCRVACPQMKYCEASDIIDNMWATWSKDDKKKLLITAVGYFFSDSLIKPCPMIDGKSCKIYDKRPLNCRLYGLWPDDSWNDRVEMFAKSTGLPREKLPLNVQCQNVRRKPQVCKECLGRGRSGVEKIDSTIGDGLLAIKTCATCKGTGKIQPAPLTTEKISALFDDLDKADKVLRISDLKISTSWNYRTFHDWLLLKFWGESALTKWTQLVLTTTPEQRQGIVEAFEAQADHLVV